MAPRYSMLKFMDLIKPFHTAGAQLMLIDTTQSPNGKALFHDVPAQNAAGPKWGEVQGENMLKFLEGITSIKILEYTGSRDEPTKNREYS